MDQYDFVRAFEPGIRAKTRHDGLAIIWCRTVGELVVTSGKLVARDPGYFEDIAPFTKEVSPGRYPVILALAHFERTADERVASAMVRFSDRKAIRWEWAKRVDPQSDTLKKEEPFCYCVDSGTGCFMDKEAADFLLEWKEEDENDLYTFLNEGEHSIVEGWEWLLDSSTGMNVIAFRSGWGDGGYPSCWGYDANDDFVCLATDFGVLNGATFLEEGEEGYHAPAQHYYHYRRPAAPDHHRWRASRPGRSHRRSGQSG